MSREAGLTTCVNVRTDAFDVYIGRQSNRAKDRRCRVQSRWHNPYKVGDGARTSEEAIRRFTRRTVAWLLKWPALAAELLNLRGKRLGCWCHPDPCHGHVLARMVDEAGTWFDCGRRNVGKEIPPPAAFEPCPYGVKFGELFFRLGAGEGVTTC